MAKFQAGEQVAVETITAALREAEQEQARVKAAAPQAALRVHTGKPDDGDAELLAHLPELDQRVDNLRLALAGAKQAEADRQQAQRLADDAAARRACSQHCGRFDKGGLKASSAIEAVASAFSDMVDARRAALACASAAIRHSGDLDYRLSDERLGRMILVEIGRCLRERGITPPRVLTHFSGEFERNGRVVPMTEIIGSVLQSVRVYLKAPSVASVPTGDAGAGEPPVTGSRKPSADNPPEPPAEVPVKEDRLNTPEPAARSSPENPLNVVRLGEVA